VGTLTDQTQQAHWGKVIAIHELAPNMAYITAPLVAEGLLRVFSWRGVLATIGSVALLLGGLYGWRGRGSDRRGEPPSLATLWILARDPSLWIVATLFVTAIGAVLGLYMMMPLFLVNELGLDREWANTIVGLSRLPGPIAVFCAGLITDRVGAHRALVLFLSAIGSLTLLLGLFRGPLATPALLFLQCAACACFFPAAFALVSQLFAPQRRNLAVSVVLLVGFLFGGGVVPSAIGLIAQAFSFASAFTGVGVLTLISVAGLLRLAPAEGYARK
jgi:NNP family nitrate/nitrite transporter-like MFS transporter